jgi:hypothetical protein
MSEADRRKQLLRREAEREACSGISTPILEKGAVPGIIQAAIYWWMGKRPVDWSEKDHLASPCVNTTSDRERKLAMWCAALLEER